jgi:hypothetical protein
MLSDSVGEQHAVLSKIAFRPVASVHQHHQIGAT